MRITHIVAARPNFMKAAPVIAALNRRAGISQSLVHTGQHYDANMSEVFFRQLGLPQPDVNLEVGSGSHAVQTAEVMVRLERLLDSDRPDWLFVYGDVNSTVASALVCAKLLIPVAHVEAGLRSRDRAMPEEINRILTDQIADLLFTPSEDGNENLAQEGVASEKVFMVGNVMIDTLVRLLPQAEGRLPELQDALGIGTERYVLVTLHRPSNVDDVEGLQKVMEALYKISKDSQIVFPVHPRTRKTLQNSKTHTPRPSVHLIEPLGYIDFLSLQKGAALVITDSGGVQEETTFLGVPCLTVRENTERPVTISLGTNLLVGEDRERLRREAIRILSGERVKGNIPPLWDGKAGERIADIVVGL